MTLIEMTLVVATIALLVGFALPAVRSMMNSFHSEGGAKSMVEAALSSARAMAASQQRYVGVRFQKQCIAKDAGRPLDRLMEAPQYMIFIMHDKAGTGLGSGFRAIEGLQPIRLPETMGVMALGEMAEDAATSDADFDTPEELNDVLTFSIVFSPAGKLIVHDVQVRNRDGVPDPDNGSGDSGRVSRDQVFNSPENICTRGVGLCVQDDHPAWGLEKEPSVKSFVVYSRERLVEVFERDTPSVWSRYLKRLAGEETIFVSPYTGKLISSR
ncbi:MAG: hypothetical protein JW741_20770 [Sedimentisphaerales bacterium]|nr:hypothetical protein [Sedimentisphaerales bacterium]